MSLFEELKRRNVIRVLVAYCAGAWLIVQIADVVFPIYGIPGSALRLLTTILVIGLVPAVIISWAFEWTPGKGLRRDADRETDQPAVSRDTRIIDRIIMLAMAFALMFFAVDRFVFGPAPETLDDRIAAMIASYGDKSIAVLPFADLSPEGDQQYFTDGISEEILNVLASIRELRVVSRSSAFEYRGDIHIPTVAEELQVAYVLEGSARRSGDKTRITAQLIDAKTDTHLWSDTWDRDLVDIFAIQDEIADIVADHLELKILRRRSESRTTDYETYEEYLRLKHAVFGIRSVNRSHIDQLERLVERDPDYVPALNLLNIVYYFETNQGADALIGFEEAKRRSMEINARALDVDPDDAIANVYRGWQLLEWDRRPHDGARHTEKAFALEPGNAEVLRVVGAYARVIGRFDIAIQFGEMSIAIDTGCGNCPWVLAAALYAAGKLEEVERLMRPVAEANDSGWHTLGNSLLLQGKPKAALEAYDKQPEPAGYWLMSRALVLHSMGREAEFDETMSRLLEETTDQYPMHLATVYAWIDDADKAFHWLDKAAELNPGFTRWAQFDSRFDALHEDPRWNAFWDEHWYTYEELAAVELNVP